MLLDCSGVQRYRSSRKRERERDGRNGCDECATAGRLIGSGAREELQQVGVIFSAVRMKDVTCWCCHRHTLAVLAYCAILFFQHVCHATCRLSASAFAGPCAADNRPSAD